MLWKPSLRNDLFTVIALSIWMFCHGCSRQGEAIVRTGLDVLIEDELDFLEGKRIGIITNHTAIDRHGKHIIDLLVDRSEFEVVALFGPEHGIRGDGNEMIANGRDAKSELPIYSLYGETRKPTPAMLEGIDILVFDIQDIGARFYTYISTMANAMEAAAENGIAFVVLDRPNPISGWLVEGPVLDLRLKSFVGVAPIPVRHGMTVGELAGLFNDEGWLNEGVRCDLTVIPMDEWRRDLWFDETGLSWVRPSPNMPDLSAATLYPGLCFLEATNVSEGRGTDEPFIQIGAPWIDEITLTDALNTQSISGTRFSPAVFTPVDLIGRVMNPKYEGELCRGVRIEVTDRERFRAVEFGIRLLCTIRDLYPDHFTWRRGSRRGMERLSGTDWIPKAIDEGKPAEEIVSRWQEGLKKFLQIRQQYLIYD